MRWTNCLWMPTAIGIHRRNHFQQLLNVNGDNDVGNTHGKVLIFVVVVLINNFGTEPHPPTIPPPKGLQHRAISSQSMLSHSSASPEWHLVSATWRPLSTLPDTDCKEGYSSSHREVSRSLWPPSLPAWDLLLWEHLTERMLALHLSTTEDPKAYTWHKVKITHWNSLHRIMDNFTVWLQQYIAQESA